MGFVNKQEFKYIVIAGAFGFIYFLYVLPWLFLKGVESIPSIFQFLLFSIGVYFLYFFMFKSWSLNTNQSFMASVIGILPFITFNILAPEYHVNLMSGALERGAMFGMATPDYVLGSFWSMFGFKGYILIPLVYFVSFVILLVLIALVKKNFVKEI